MKNVAIVGFGCAGFQCVKALRDCGFNGDIDVYSDSDLPPSNPMLTTYYAGGKIPMEALFPFGEIESIKREYKICFKANSKVTKIEGNTRTILTEDGSKKKYDKILISTGARAFVPPVESLPEENVYYMRTVEDAIAFKDCIEKDKPRKIVVIGASMVGIKVAEIAANKGIECLLADMAPRIFPLAAVDSVAKRIHDKVREKGVELRFSVGLTGVTSAKNGGLHVHLGDEIIGADAIVLSIGTRPILDMLNPKEFNIDRGLVVDDKMQTNIQGIYGAGDCTAGNNLQTGESQIIGLWANAGYQGRMAGLAMIGKCDTYAGNILHNITHFMDMDFIGMGDVRAEGVEIHHESKDESFVFHAVKDANGNIACVNILDNYLISGVVKNYVTKLFLGRTEEISEIQRVMLKKSGFSDDLIEQLEGATNDE